jgi:predicted transcriptional regulator
MKVYKHFSHTTPFSLAENDQELAEIMRLKYPKACSNLETGAEFFARMVEDVRKFEAWKVIGFVSFEEFCAKELGKTLVEVEEIVEGVKLLGGNPSEEEAKAASKASRIRKLAEERPGMTRAEISREVGATRAQVTQVLTKPRNAKMLTPNITVRMASDVERTAANIHAKMGAEYCQKLIKALEEITHGI